MPPRFSRLTAKAHHPRDRCGASRFSVELHEGWERSSPKRLHGLPTTRVWRIRIWEICFSPSADGAESRKLTSVSGDILNIAWSPDSRRLRFDSSETAGTVGQQLEWEVSVAGNDLHRLMQGWHNPPDECCGRWTPDGRSFVFKSNGQIWALPEKTIFHRNPQPVLLTSSPLSLSSPLPSKDGKKLFVIGQTFRGELMRYDASAGRLTPFLNGLSGEYRSVLERRSMGHVCFLSRGNTLAQQGRWQRAHATHVSTDVSGLAPLVAGRQEDHLLRIRPRRRQAGSHLRDLVRWRHAPSDTARRSPAATGSKLVA